MADCLNCGVVMDDAARFCSSCGTAVAQAASSNPLRDVKKLACDAADDMIDAGEDMVDVVSSGLGKKMAAGAAVGALVAAPIPVIGWAAGAAVGAGLVAVKYLNNKA